MLNPYENTASLPETQPRVIAKETSMAQRGFCWLMISTGVFLILCSIVFVVVNGLSWMVRREPIGVQALMLFVVLAFGAIPATIGYVLQHYGRCRLRPQRTEETS